MRKDNLPVWPHDTNKGGSKSLEVFFLGEPKPVNKPLPPVTKDSSFDFPTFYKDIENLKEQDVNENSAGEGAHEFCSPVGHKGHTGITGYSEGTLQLNLYELVLDSLNNALPDSTESFREVLADGITIKINKYLKGD